MDANDRYFTAAMKLVSALSCINGAIEGLEQGLPRIEFVSNAIAYLGEAMVVMAQKRVNDPRFQFVTADFNKLREFVVHDVRCAWNSADRHCTCGLNDLLDKMDGPTR